MGSKGVTIMSPSMDEVRDDTQLVAIIDEHPGEVEEESPIAHANPTIDQNGEEIEAIKAMSGCLA